LVTYSGANYYDKIGVGTGTEYICTHGLTTLKVKNSCVDAAGTPFTINIEQERRELVGAQVWYNPFDVEFSGAVLLSPYSTGNTLFPNDQKRRFLIGTIHEILDHGELTDWNPQEIINMQVMISPQDKNPQSRYNENAPIVTAGQSFSFPEDIGNGIALGAVEATDADTLSLVGNWAITDESNPPNAVKDVGKRMFRINKVSGEIYINSNAEINYEWTSIYNINVTCSDGKLTSVPVGVTLNVGNVNDEIPYIGVGQSFNVQLPLLVNAEVGTVLGYDNDALTPLMFWEITSGNSEDNWKIDAATGTIIVNDPTGLTAGTTHTIFVKASDGSYYTPDEAVDIEIIAAS